VYRAFRRLRRGFWPIIGQRAFAIHEDDTLETVRRRGLEQEWQLYPECIQLFAEGR